LPLTLALCHGQRLPVRLRGERFRSHDAVSNREELSSRRRIATSAPLADQDLERDNEEKTSAVHFLVFELPPEQIEALKEGAPLAAGIDHENYHVEVRPVPDNVRRSLANDLD
ncbi:MAG TPA: DUF3501 family protein, partial [Woeseiaceae bacterium]|nr:DUF3501 family protein [Woeseiaceae bacterium]